MLATLRNSLAFALLILPIQMAMASPSASSFVDPNHVDAIWDERGAQTQSWTLAAVDAIENEGEILITSEPADIADYCPAYADLSMKKRAAFWVNLISTLALLESSFKANSSYTENFKNNEGTPDISRGLLQLSADDISLYHCKIAGESGLFDPRQNLSCGIKIMATLVSQDSVVQGRLLGHQKGLARYWGPMRNDADIALIKMSSSQLSFCH